MGAGVLMVLLSAVFVWWAMLPRTPRELFLARCSSCHELRIARLCEFEPALRPAIVDVMRHEHGADQVISAEEALAIRDYLKEAFICP
ncbi:hypothetical protein [Sedimenticola selenatireducens]|uniref:hypothetical protein n=1 Tax=Sedimenticola selenatireducens TaxID=191960 RepID=UPI002AABCFF8|nr:hypothetical protein [Sedimenticola selenatireducens]